MKWQHHKIEHLGWSKEIDRIEEKRAVAGRVAERVRDAARSAAALRRSVGPIWPV